MQKKKICLICEFPPPPGGMSNQALILDYYLNEEGFTVRKCKINIKLPSFLQWLDKFNFFKVVIKLPIMLTRMLSNIVKSDVVHIFSICGLYFYVVVIPAVLISKVLGKRVIVNYHAGYFTNFYDDSFKGIVRRVLKLSDFVTTPLFYLKEEFSSVGVKITKVPNVLDLKKFTFKERKTFSPKFISSRHLRSVYGNDVVIRAFEIVYRKYPHATLTIAGDGDKRDELEKLAKELDVQDNVLFTGYINQDQLFEQYEKADIFLNGSRRDNMPISILESFALGLPVVSTNPMGIPYLVSDGITGLLSEIDDFEGLAMNALSIIEKPHYGQMLVMNAKKFIGSLTWKSVYPILSKVYFE